MINDVMYSYVINLLEYTYIVSLLDNCILVIACSLEMTSEYNGSQFWLKWFYLINNLCLLLLYNPNLFNLWFLSVNCVRVASFSTCLLNFNLCLVNLSYIFSSICMCIISSKVIFFISVMVRMYDKCLFNSVRAKYYFLVMMWKYNKRSV